MSENEVEVVILLIECILTYLLCLFLALILTDRLCHLLLPITFQCMYHVKVGLSNNYLMILDCFV